MRWYHWILIAWLGLQFIFPVLWKLFVKAGKSEIEEECKAWGETH